LAAYCANLALPFVNCWRGWNRSIYRGWLGDHKTVIGLYAKQSGRAACAASMRFSAASQQSASLPSALVPHGQRACAQTKIETGAVWNIFLIQVNNGAR